MQLELKDLLYLVQGAVIPILIGIASALSGLRKDLATISKDQAAIKAWQDGHDERCDERHELHRRGDEKLWAELGRIRDRRTTR